MSSAAERSMGRWIDLLGVPEPATFMQLRMLAQAVKASLQKMHVARQHTKAPREAKLSNRSSLLDGVHAML